MPKFKEGVESTESSSDDRDINAPQFEKGGDSSESGEDDTISTLSVKVQGSTHT